MTTIAWLGLAVGIIAANFTIGTGLVLGIAYMAARLGGRWFTGAKRWEEQGELGVPPLALLIAWWIILPVGLIFLMGRGWTRMAEVAGDALIKTAEAQAARLRGKTS